MLCGKGFKAHGEVRLLSAHIGGQLNLTGAILGNQDGPAATSKTQNRPALDAAGITVDQDMLCGEGFKARGEVRLVLAHIGGVLAFLGATLENQSGPALNADALTVGRAMICGKGFKARGEVRLTLAHIGGELELTGTTLENESGIALNAEWLTVDQAMTCKEDFRAHGEVNLVNAKVGSLLDEPGSWPMTMHLRGFVYELPEDDQVTMQQRLGWLTLSDGGYVPQMYDQLATAYRNAGREDDARRVAIAKQRRRRHPLNPLNWVWYATVGYGYRTWLAGVWLAAFLAVGTWVFSRAHMTATQAHPPAFHAFAYAADVILPIVDLGQKSAWTPEGIALYWSWGLTCAGWVLTTAVVAGLTGVLKRD